MARKRKITGEIEAILQSRLQLLPDAPLFTYRRLASGWDITPPTLHRYRSPAYRALSVKLSRVSYERQTRSTICAECHKPLRSHARCADCTILLHDIYKLCDNCFDTRERHKLQPALLANISAYGTTHH